MDDFFHDANIEDLYKLYVIYIQKYTKMSLDPSKSDIGTTSHHI